MADSNSNIPNSNELIVDDGKMVTRSWFRFFRDPWLASLSVSTKVFPGTDSGRIQSSCGIYAGSGAPSNANGNNGDVYFRSDGGALTTVYQKRAGAWVGVV